MSSYDAIIIGSGAGGLTAAVALAQAGKKVLVLEQHDTVHAASPPGRDSLCGASTLSHGVAGVTASGIDVAKAVLNCRTRDLLKQNGPSLTFLPSEDVSQWPEYLRRKIERGEAAREEEEREV